MKVKKIWIDDDKIFITTDANDTLWQSLLWYPRLRNATQSQRDAYRLTEFGIRFDEIDEDISYESFTFEEREPNTPIGNVIKTIPEINISQFARRIGIAQSVLASYITGAKTPSAERKRFIESELHKLGEQLTRITL